MAPDSANTLSIALQVAEILAIVVGGGMTLVKLGGITTRFEMIGEQQGREIKELKESVQELNKVVTAQALQSLRLDTQGVQLNQLRDEISDLRRNGRGHTEHGSA